MKPAEAHKIVQILVKRFVSKQDYVTDYELNNLQKLFVSAHEKTVNAALELLFDDIPANYGKLPEKKLVAEYISRAKNNYVESKQQKGYCPCCGGSTWLLFVHRVGSGAGQEWAYRCDCSRNPAGQERDYHKDNYDKCNNISCQNPDHLTRMEVRAGDGHATKAKFKNCMYKPSITELPPINKKPSVNELMEQIL